MDDDGAPDDVVFLDVKFLHIERMDDGHIWMGVNKADGRSYVCDFYTPRNGRLLWRVEED